MKKINKKKIVLMIILTIGIILISIGLILGIIKLVEKHKRKIIRIRNKFKRKR